MCYWKLNYQNVSNQIAQFLNPMVSLDSAPRLMMKQWARFARCCADSSQGASVPPATIAADSAVDSTVTGLVQGYISLNMPGIDLVTALMSPAPSPAAKATVDKWYALREAQGSENCQPALRYGRETAVLRGIKIAGTGKPQKWVLGKNLWSFSSSWHNFLVNCFPSWLGSVTQLECPG